MLEFLSISLLIMLAAISPGPDFAIVTKNALLHSRTVAIFTALGVSVSLLIHSIYCILGFSIIISQSLVAFTILKYIGAAYLIYIGFKSIIARKDADKLQNNNQDNSLTNKKAFYQGLFCNLLNPKAIMFLMAFFTLIMKPEDGLLYEFGYGLEIALIHMIWFTSLAYLITHERIRVHLDQFQFYIVKAMGFGLVYFGLHIATLEHAFVLPAVIK